MQLHVFDYFVDVPGATRDHLLVEVQFKNTRKGYFYNSNGLRLEKGDVVAVEAMPGHDIGKVTMTGPLVLLQMQKACLPRNEEIRRVYRHAKPADLEKFEAAKAREHQTMIEARRIAKDLKLAMKIGDVEFQGDGLKAIFYYIADQRVDFRKLIKVLAEAFRVRIEMRQIGARQEAGRIGGIGPCGRELCCAAWLKNFQTVTTAAARVQDITPNPQKLAGQCAKLKCCLNYETDVYMDAARHMPERNVPLETADGTFYHFKGDILAGLVTYSTDRRMPANLTTITARRAKQVIAMNRAGLKPAALAEDAQAEVEANGDLAGQDELTRFDRSRQKRNGKKKRPEGPRRSERRDAENTERQARRQPGDVAAGNGNNNNNNRRRRGPRDNGRGE